MKNWKRLLALVLCLCLLPVWALAKEEAEPVTHSDFEVSLKLFADGFPMDGAAHYAQWERFLNKISIRGEADSQYFLQPVERLYVNGGVYLDNELRVPFEYDNYYTTFRYLRSPVLDGASVHFQFLNFFQFMLKPYYYMGLQSQLLGVAMYPQAVVAFVDKLAAPIQETLSGKKSRTVSYKKLGQLCKKLNNIVLEDAYEATYYLLTCLLIDTGLDVVVLEKMACWEDVLEYLDPKHKGMKITIQDGVETWTLGETTVYEKITGDGETLMSIYLPEEEGYVFTLEYQGTEDAHQLSLALLYEESEQVALNVSIDGLSDPLRAEGQVYAEVYGDALYESVEPQSFAYRYTRSAESLPAAHTLEVDWLHPETGEAAIGLRYQADMTQLPAEAIYDRPYDNQDDFFHLNEGFLEEYKERFLPTLALGALPFLMEMPSGVISDVVAWMDETGFLAFFGIE